VKVAVINYDAGNTRSVMYALRRLGVEPVLTADAGELLSADRVVFPGVGHAAWAMEQLKARGLDTVIPTLTCPFLGICLGMQIMCRFSEEGNVPCLGIFNATVQRFPESVGKVPHMGWNTVQGEAPAMNGRYFYFVHSYYVPLVPETMATSQYPFAFSAALKKDNFTGVQFHPEKSGPDGALLLKQFLLQS
jgi:glutamine amidotransferase